jgi:uncharacterized damage-inducible protein DinB
MKDLAAISLGELLAYDEHEVTRWHEWFKRQPAEILDLPTKIAEGNDLRWLLFHIFAVQLRYAEWLLELPTRSKEEFLGMPRQSVEDLFTIGAHARKLLADFADKATPEELAKVLAYSSPNFKLSATKRKCFLQSILHGDRHWAQIAALVREAGYKTDWVHDIVMSPAMQ